MLEGIDIEPDRPGMQMTDVVLRDVTVRNNSVVARISFSFYRKITHVCK